MRKVSALVREITLNTREILEGSLIHRAICNRVLLVHTLLALTIGADCEASYIYI